MSDNKKAMVLVPKETLPKDAFYLYTRGNGDTTDFKCLSHPSNQCFGANGVPNSAGCTKQGSNVGGWVVCEGC